MKRRRQARKGEVSSSANRVGCWIDPAHDSSATTRFTGGKLRRLAILYRRPSTARHTLVSWSQMIG